MAATEEAARIDRELEEARSDLRATLELVNHKVEAVEANLRPQAIIRRHTLAVSCVAILLGYVAGRADESPPVEWIAIGALLGAAIGASEWVGNGKHDVTVETVTVD
jgi:hypothetical protein